MSNIVHITFVDLETTGLDPENAEIIEMATVSTVAGKDYIRILGKQEFKIYPELPVDPFITNINGFNEEDWYYNSVPLYEALGNVFTQMRGSWHAGSNPKFDEAFLKRAAKKFNWQYPSLASYHLLDVSTLGFHLLLNESVEKLKQETLCKYYNISGGGHRALADALQCVELFACINNLKIVTELN